MSKMPARVYTDLDRQQLQQGKSPQQQSREGASSSKKSTSAHGPSSSYSRIWEGGQNDIMRSEDRSLRGGDADDQMQDDKEQRVGSGRDDAKQNQNPPLSKRKAVQQDSGTPSDKRSRMSMDIGSIAPPLGSTIPAGQAETSPSVRPTPYEERLRGLSNTASGSFSREGDGELPSPRSASRSPSSSDEAFSPSSSEMRDAVLAPEEVDTFLDLIFKHHPEPMTAENMRKSVDALYVDWQAYCSERGVPAIQKKPLMDEYGKIFNGAYGSKHQSRARAIAHELSQRAIGAEEDDAVGQGSPSRGNTKPVASDRNSEAGDVDTSQAQDTNKEKGEGASSRRKGNESIVETKQETRATAATSGQTKSTIAQVGRNGLAVLPPGLFDILRTHLKDDILSSIMPLIRTDLSEQTRELFLQNQDLFGRIKEMEEQMRNQDMWIRHLLARDSTDWPPPPHVPLGPTGGNFGSRSNTRSFGAASKDSSTSRHSRYGLFSESDQPPGGLGDYFGGGGLSPRQQRLSQQQGLAGPSGWDARSPGAVAPMGTGSGTGAGAGAGARPGSGPVLGAGNVRWESSVPSRDAPVDRRSSYLADVAYRREAWDDEGGPRGGWRQALERPDFSDPRMEPAQPRRASRPVTMAERGFLGMGEPRGLASPAGALPPPSSASSSMPQGGPNVPHEEFRRPPPPPPLPQHGPGPEVSSPPAYDTRRGYQGLPISQADSEYGIDPTSSSMNLRPPLPPRTIVATPEALRRNKRGRPSNAELTLRNQTNQADRQGLGVSDPRASR